MMGTQQQEANGNKKPVAPKKKAAKKKTVKVKAKTSGAKKPESKPIGKRIDSNGKEKVLTIEVSQELEEQIQGAMKTIEKLVGQRKIINAKVKGVYDDLEAQGIHRDEVKLVVKLAACDEQQRKFRDQSRRIIRKALDVPDETEKQLKMFDAPKTIQ